MSRESVLAARIDAVPVRGDTGVARAIVGKRAGNSIFLEIDGNYIRLTLASIVPARRTCLAPRCSVVFHPMRSIDCCCSESCKRELMYLRRRKAIAEGRCRMTDRDRDLIAFLVEVGEATASALRQRCGNWVGNSLRRLEGRGMIEKIGPRKGGVYKLVSDRSDSIAQ